ncbi:tryptophan synthase alpha chain [Siminovitchia terrae]|uniref:Tryptophan synthase alpha chain n=1 Tax=Siminovitchia terrae TaxID=1914933 RepID=A0A429X637_SIMTE|nr:tryptophan synthase subunit alpha [Siminovitchia terrae]RST58839.1 tryptophan synthase subunit alpha [Siminovitchia terrae]GIN95355.1 tryptophan synthase alpha chain [Siminovitchia terrae]
MGKEHINEAIQGVLERGNKAFVPYIMAGDGGLEKLADQISFLEKSGATVIELGIPFSDPVADGPTIQEAGIRALENGTTLKAVLETLKESKKSRSIPIVLMTYFNLIFVYGIERFAEECEAAGVDGVIIPDLPLEEEDSAVPALSKHEIALIRLASPTSPKSRLEEIVKRTEGFLYAVTVKGTTGARSEYEEGVAEYLEELKSLSSVPVLAGFGVSSPEQVKDLGQHCDGVIVGSKIVQALSKGKEEEILELINASKQAFINPV